MNLINEKIGYIDKKIFNLNNIVNTISDFICSDKLKWSRNYEVKGKLNQKDIQGFNYKQWTYDLHNNVLGFIKIILVNITEEDITSYKFQGFIDGSDDAFYSPVDSTTDKKRNNCGYVYLNYNTISELKNNVVELKHDLISLLYHEFRHYYDNVMGLFTGLLKYLTDIYLIAGELGIDKPLVFKDKWKESLGTKDTTYNSLNRLLYISDPTELNAWYHSFVQDMLAYVQKHPETTKESLLKYIKDEKLNKGNIGCFIYNYAIVYKSIGNYKMTINKLCDKDPLKLYHYITTTLTNNNVNDKVLTRLNNLFEKEYLNYWKDDINMEVFGQKLSDFINDYYMDFIYKKVSRIYLHTVKNMNKYISTLI